MPKYKIDIQDPKKLAAFKKLLTELGLHEQSVNVFIEKAAKKTAPGKTRATPKAKSAAAKPAAKPEAVVRLKTMVKPKAIAGKAKAVAGKAKTKTKK